MECRNKQIVEWLSSRYVFVQQSKAAFEDIWQVLSSTWKVFKWTWFLASDSVNSHLSSFTFRLVYWPGHFLLLTRHSLISEISGQGWPKGDGYWMTCLVRVSWPLLKPHVLPDREQELHSLHSPTSQCTVEGEGKVRGAIYIRIIIIFMLCVHVFISKLWLALKETLMWLRPFQQNSLFNCTAACLRGVLFIESDLVGCTPWVCHWAWSPLDRHGGTSRWAGTDLVCTVCTSHCSHMTRTLQRTLKQKQILVMHLRRANTGKPLLCCLKDVSDLTGCSKF